MAILTYNDVAPLQGFYAWAQQQGVPPAAPCPQGNVLEILPRLLTRGTYSESGDTVRFSAFLASGDAVIDFGGQWANDAGEYKRYNATLTMTAAESPKRISMPASAGWYRDAAASVRTAGISGQTLYITQELGRANGAGFAPFAMLAQGWLTSAAPVGNLPNIPLIPGGGGGTCVCNTELVLQGFEIDVGGQAAFATRTPAAGTKERIVVAVVTASTGATVGNRALRFDWRDLSVGQLGWIRTPDTITANRSVSLNGYVEVPTQTVLTEFFYVPLPGSVYMQAPYNMASDIEQFQTGDEITDTYAVIEVTS